MKRIGVDVGGTFTDFIYVDEDEVQVYKTSTTPEDPSEGIMTGINALCELTGTGPEEIDEVFHGTTIATNMVLEKKGSRVGMITTEGFRDILHTARHKRPHNFSIMQELPWQVTPVARRRDRYAVTERITPPYGDVHKALNEEEVREAVCKMKKDGVSAIAVCFMFSFLNPAHEQRVREIILEEIPDAYISLRSEIAPQFREYESFTTTCLNSYVGPKTASYVEKLMDTLTASGFVNANLHLMQSAGGVATGEAAAIKPVNLLMSGPVGGVLGAVWTSKLTDIENVITLDIGGTSADLSVLADLKPGMKHLLDTQVGGFTAMVPMIDISTIGAGGGSIAYIDEGGFFRVGPESAGAVPGPACYDRGGKVPTVTDANILLGRLGTELLGGRMHIKPELAEKVIEDKLCKELKQSVTECALGIIDIMNNNMVQAIEKDSVRRGFDPRDFALFACGGAGALHACSVARMLDMKQVIVPRNPGALCAVGLVTTNLLYDYTKTEMIMSTEPDYAKMSKDYAELEKQAFDRLVNDKVSEEDIEIKRYAECRYAGQGYELRVPVLGGVCDENTINAMKEEFHKAHEGFFGTSYPNTPVEIATIRVDGTGYMPEFTADPIEIGTEDASAAKTGSREAVFRVNGEIVHVNADIYDREKLLGSNIIEGPAIINQMDTTIVIEPKCVAKVNEYGVIVIGIDIN